MPLKLLNIFNPILKLTTHATTHKPFIFHHHNPTAISHSTQNSTVYSHFPTSQHFQFPLHHKVLKFQFQIITVYFLLIAAVRKRIFIYIHADTAPPYILHFSFTPLEETLRRKNNNFFSIESSSGFLRDLQMPIFQKKKYVHAKSGKCGNK